MNGVPRVKWKSSAVVALFEQGHTTSRQGVKRRQVQSSQSDLACRHRPTEIEYDVGGGAGRGVGDTGRETSTRGGDQSSVA